MSVWQPRYSSILAAATLPAATAKITVAGPETQSPPEKTPSMPGTLPSSAATMLFRLTGTPAWAKSLESTAWPTAMRTTSQGMTSWGWSASRGAGRPPRTITWGWTTRPVTLPFSSVWMATGAFRGRTSQPSAMAPSISSGRAVMSAMRRRCLAP